MTKLQNLKKVAEAAAANRGHKLGGWSKGTLASIAVCSRCGAMAVVDSSPEPYGVEIVGRAVAITCPTLIITNRSLGVNYDLTGKGCLPRWVFREAYFPWRERMLTQMCSDYFMERKERQ